jgi:CRP/FNR family transcriptional regulator
MSLAAAYFNNKSVSHGVVMEDTEVLVFPAELIMAWQLKYPSWNQYVLQIFRKRYDELINSFEGLVFEHINVRVLEYLRRKSELEGSKIINTSHQNLADELGTTRVVISRILKQFEKEKKIKLLRGQVELKA